MSGTMDTSDSVASSTVAPTTSPSPATASNTMQDVASSSSAAAITSSSASSASAAASSSPAPAASSSAMPSASPAPTPAEADEEESLINDNANFDEDELMDVKETKKKRGGRAAAAAAVSSSTLPADALDRLNELLLRTEQFSKFMPAAKAAPKKGRGRHNVSNERAEEEAEDKELVNDELQQAEGAKTWPEHLEEQPSSVVKAGGLPMRPYQLEALNWLIKLHDQNLNGILADEMGLGKTLMSLSLLAYLKQYRNYAGPHLIIVPKSTSGNWLREVGRWTNNLKCFKFHGNEEERTAMKPLVTQNDITITTYEMVIREKSFFAKIKWKYIYIDEAHRIKNENSLLSRVVRTFQSDHRLLITGTPLQNNLHELWALLNFLVPSLFNSSDDFESWFDFSSAAQNATEAAQRQEIVSRLHRLLRPFLLRRLKSEVEKALLPKIETKLFVGMSEMQHIWYKKVLSREIEVLNATSTSKVRLLNIVMQLRKVCNHPYLFTGAEPGPPYLEGEHIVENSSKMVLLDKLLKKLKANGHRVLIFSQMTRILDILEDYTRYRGYEYCRIDGQTKQEERDEAMEVFNAPNSSKFLFLLSTRAGGLGINLQTADTVILFDSDWNPQMDLQAMDRAHRIGQKKQVTVFRFVVEDSIEQKMVERATKKLFLDALVVKQGRLNDAEKTVSANELQEMVRFGANRIFQGANSSELTDADIDAILARGTELTRIENEKMKENASNDILNFSSTESSESYAIKAQPKKQPLELFELAKRERKSNYDINAYYRDALRVNEKKPEKSKREWKPTQRFDYQFFQLERLEALERKDHEAKMRLFALQSADRQKEREENKARAEREKEERKRMRAQRMREQRAAQAAAGQTATTTADDDKDMDSDDEAHDDAAAASSASATVASSSTPAASSDAPVKMEIDGEEPQVKSEVKSEPAAVKTEGDAVMKTEDEPSAAASSNRKSTRSRNSTVKKESSAAPSPSPVAGAEEEEEEATDADDARNAQWYAEAGCLTEAERAELTKLQNQGFSTWQRRHLTSFIKAMEKYGRSDLSNIKQSVEEKTPDEVEKYYFVFWKQYRTIKDWDKLIKQIEKGEIRLAKQKALQAIIDNKVKRYRGNFEKMTIPYPTTTQKSFTEEEDKFLIISLHRLGYGNWEDLKQAIRSSWMFRFDWYIKSRTCGELSKRVEYLLKLLEKEQAEWDEKREAAESKKRAKAIREAKAALASSAAAVASPVKKPKAEKEKEKEKESKSSKKDKESSSSKDKDKDKEKSKKKDRESSKDKEKEGKSHKKDKSEKESKSAKKEKEKEKDSSSSKKEKKDKESSKKSSSSAAASSSSSSAAPNKKRKEADSSAESKSIKKSETKKQKTAEE